MAIKFKITHGNYSAEGTSATIKCNGKKLAEDIVIECEEVAEVTPSNMGKLTVFTADGDSYYYFDIPKEGCTGSWLVETYPDNFSANLVGYMAFRKNATADDLLLSGTPYDCHISHTFTDGMTIYAAYGGSN